MATDDTIVAIATPLGEGGLGVVRLSGPEAVAIASRVFSNAALAAAASHTLHHGWLRDGSESVDEAVAALFRSPRSYTGDDVVELSCHGSPAALSRVVGVCLKNGARLAQPGEFTLRAFLNGKMDLVQAEAVADLIHAKSSAAGSAAAAQLKGELSKRLAVLRGALVDLLAHVEANLDFVEEDIPGLARASLARGLQSIENDMHQLLSTSLKGRYLRDGVRLALVGRPNVGKSSLFNALLAQDRAIVSDVAGTTRDTLDEHLQWDGFPILITDTAGLRATSDAVEREGAERARRAGGAADVAVLVLDGSGPFADDDAAIACELRERSVVAALNKSDRPAVLAPADVQKRTGAAAVVSTSALTGAGLGELKEAVMKILTGGAASAGGAHVITNRRHVRHLEKAADHVAAARQAAAGTSTEEAIALDLRDAARELSAITGESVTDDVLTSIFSRFCIGK